MTDSIVEGDCMQRVAFDLMCEIAETEADGKKRFAKPDPRTYYLILYHQCLKAVSGDPIEDVLNSEATAGRAINLG